MQYSFEWDQQKAKMNSRKHGVTFDRAASVFLDPRILSIFDEVHSEREERWITIGIDNSGTLLALCHTYRQETSTSVLIRIFSARKATARESEQYRE